MISQQSNEEIWLISPSFWTLKKLLKLPMIVLLLTAGLMTGLNSTIIKLFGLSILSGAHEPLAFGLLAFKLFQAALVVVMLNLAMAHYPQLDVVPIYQSFGVATIIFAGMIFYGELKFYTA
jgi:hypothetical protein